MKRAEDLKRISTNVIKQKERQEEKLYLKIIFSKWFIDIMKNIEEKAISIAETGEQELLLDRYRINPLNESYLSSEVDFLQYTFLRYLSQLGYNALINIYPVFNKDELLCYSFTGKISW